MSDVKILVLSKIDFDNMENYSPLYTTELGLFSDSCDGTAHFKINKFLEKLENIKPYLGYDGDVYPKYSITSKYLK